jgi:SAM-dependent methyltransferase
VIVACALCGARNTRRLYTKFDYGIERCRRCGLVYANPRASEADILRRYSHDYFWNEYLPASGAPGGRVDHALNDGRNAPLLNLLRAHAPGGRRLLEVGTGAGLFLKAAERAGWEVGGVELSTEGSAFARDRLGLDVRTERAEAMTFPAGSFDAAVMSEVIEHLFDPPVVLKAIHGALGPGGVLAITTPNLAALSRHILGLQWSVLSPLEHLYYFTGKTLGRMVEACGFEVRASRPLLPLPPTSVMNARATHDPASWRARRYARFVDTHDTYVKKYNFNLSAWLQKHGLADTLVMVGRKR